MWVNWMILVEHVAKVRQFLSQIHFGKLSARFTTINCMESVGVACSFHVPDLSLNLGYEKFSNGDTIVSEFLHGCEHGKSTEFFKNE